MLNKMAGSKFCLDVFGKLMGLLGELLALLLFLTLKKGTRTCNFQSNEPL